MKLKGKVAFVTGAASGMGKAQSARLAREGARVIATDVNREALEEHVNAIKQDGGEAMAIVADVSSKSSIDAAVKQGIEAFGPIDILLNTAGVFDMNAKSLDTDEDLWDKVMDINLKGVYLTTNAVLPSMLEKGDGTIVNIASVAGLTTGGGGAAYTASKHGVVGYTKQLSRDYGKDGIRVNAIAPGFIATGMTDALEDVDTEAFTSAVPAQRGGEADEIASLTLFLVSDDSDFIHGTVLPIDGGLLVGSTIG